MPAETRTERADFVTIQPSPSCWRAEQTRLEQPGLVEIGQAQAAEPRPRPTRQEPDELRLGRPDASAAASSRMRATTSCSATRSGSSTFMLT